MPLVMFECCVIILFYFFDTKIYPEADDMLESPELSLVKKKKKSKFSHFTNRAMWQDR